MKEKKQKIKTQNVQNIMELYYGNIKKKKNMFMVQDCIQLMLNRLNVT